MDAAREGPHDDRAARREFRDAAGQAWVVYERQLGPNEWTPADEESSRAGYGAGWLWFESGDDHRRLRLYPLWWFRLTDTALDALRVRARAPGG